MDAYSSCGSENNDEGQALEMLLDAFGSVFSLEDIASAYCKAGRNADVAREILYGLQETNCTTASHTSNVRNHASNGECSGVKSRELLLENNFEKSTHVDKNSRRLKPRKVSYSIGTVSSVLGKGYAKPVHSLNDARKATKPLKLKMKEPSANGPEGDIVSSGFPRRNESINNKDVEEFLFSMLGDGFQLGMDVIREVLCQCGYDAKKSMDRLLDLSASTSDKQEDLHGDAIRKVTYKNSSESYSQEKSELMDIGQCKGAMGWNGTEQTCADKKKHDLSREVLEALFAGPERFEEAPKKTRPVRAVKKKAVGTVVTAPLTDFDEKSLPEIVEPEDGAEEAEEDTYQVLRREAKQNWDAKRRCYEAALDAFLKGDRAQAASSMEEGKKYDTKAREADEKSAKEILEVRKRIINKLVTLDVHNCEAKEVIRRLKFHLRCLAGIPSVLKVVVETRSEEITKGARKRLVLKLLERGSIKWTEEEGNAGTLVIQMEDIPKSLSFHKVQES